MLGSAMASWITMFHPCFRPMLEDDTAEGEGEIGGRRFVDSPGPFVLGVCPKC